MTAWTDADTARLRELWEVHHGRFRVIARVMGRTRGSIDGKSRVLVLQFHGGRATVLGPSHPAARAGRTIFPSRVIGPDGNVLKSGDNQRKLGKVVRKGKWRGFPIFSLTLEERATCPRSCALWLSCYGSNMGHAKRYRHGTKLEAEIWRELEALQKAHAGGFVIRLHLLGDFYSAAYVALWARALDAFPALRVFGYTAWQSETPIGRAVQSLRDARWDRFAVRTSGAKEGPRTAVVVPDSAVPLPDSAIMCPAQTGKTKNCSSCALCWQTKRPIAFALHG